jgi:hypothetical protein
VTELETYVSALKESFMKMEIFFVCLVMKHAKNAMLLIVSSVMEIETL